MKSFGFPKMFTPTGAKQNMLSDKEAVRSNMLLLLSSERNTLFGDPYFGSQLHKWIFEQSDSLIVDLLIDEFYTTIKTFMPQVFLTRKDIQILVDNNNLLCKIHYYYVIDKTSDLFVIKLTESSEQV